MMFDIKNNRGHYEVFCDGEYIFSADTIEEAEEDIENYKQAINKV